MKWQNKGHEFDALGEIFKKNKDLLVIGNEESLKNIKKELDFLNTKIEYKTLKEVFSIPILSGFKLKNKTIVIADNNQETLEKLLKIKWLKHNENIFLGINFLRFFLSIYALYVCNKVYAGISTCIIITTHCPLNCKYCLNYEPYIKNKKHRDFEEIKNDIDLFFKCFDRVKYFSISGGEPFLYPKFGELIKYINSNYIDKINSLWFATSCGALPNDETLKIIKESNIDVYIDDYTENASFTKSNYDKLIKKLDENNISYVLPAGNIKFIKTFPPKEDYTKYTEEQLINKYQLCQNAGTDLRDGKLYSCCYSSFADTAQLVPALEDDVYNLMEFDESKKRELVEFKLYYTEKGYVNFCKYCNGFVSNNNIYDENGVTQLERGKILE
ncbi:radical SAM protein [Brachyspira murdochii]|uniref:radical SAM protein n=1 Tax=Brachyspira murdochii TaxID=84378 RepID=UPI0030052EAD